MDIQRGRHLQEEEEEQLQRVLEEKKHRVEAHLYDVPRARLPVVRQVYVVLVVVEREGDLVTSESPRAELHDARLLVEREVGHVYRAGALEERGKRISEAIESFSRHL